MSTKKSLKYLSKLDILFLVLVTAAFFSIAGTFFKEVWGRNGQAGGEQIGTITFKNRYAERKVLGYVLWNGVVQNGPVFNSDTIRTARESAAVLHLKNKAEISMGEETMVVVALNEKGAKIGVDSGLIALTKQAGPAVEISTKSGTVSVENGTVAIAQTAAGAEFHVTSGAAVITQNGQTKTLTPAEEPVLLSQPEAGEVLISTDRMPQAQFTWKVQRPGFAENLVVSADPEFKKVEYSAKVTGSTLMVNLNPGTHFWRLTGAAGYSRTSWFNLRAETQPRDMTPENKRVFRYVNKPPMVNFSWSPVNSATYYRLSVFAAGKTDKPFFTQDTFQNTLSAEGFTEGDYTWQISAFCGPKSVELKSPEAHFTVKKEPPEVPVIQVVQGETSSFSNLALENGVLVAKWKEVEGVDHYEAKISKDPEGKNVVLALTTKTNSLRIDQSLETGKYYLKISAVSGEAASNESESMEFSVTKPVPIRSLSPRDGERLNAGDPSIYYHWSDPNLGSRFRLVVSRNPDLSAPVLDVKVNKTEADLALPKGVDGNLYWRVQLLGAKEEVLAQSGVWTYFMPTLLTTPVPNSPVNGEVVDTISHERAHFAWPKISGASGYNVKIYRLVAGMKTLVTAWNGADQAIDLKFTDLTAGAYVWELNAERMTEGKMTGQSMTTQSFFKVTQSRGLLAPELDLNFGDLK